MNVFVGRSDELATIDGVYTAARAGTPTVIWVEGVAGAGKSALAREAVSRAGPDAIVHRTEGDELAVHEPFAAVTKWLQAKPESPFSAGMALLEGLDAVETGRFILVVVEDMHWVDPDSRKSLLTMARRFDHAPVVMFVTSRPGGPFDADVDGWHRFRTDPGRCRDLSIGPLSIEDVVALGSERGIDLDPIDAARIHRHTHGHALYVATLLNELPPERLRDTAGPLPVPRSLASTTLGRLATLPGSARDLAGAMAVVNRPAPLSMLALVAGIDSTADALDALLGTGFVEWTREENGPLTVVSFAHPLYRTAIYDDLSPSRRRALHLGAAAVSGGSSAFAHRVAAADESDEALAGELEVAAGRLRIAGEHATASTYLRWSADISGDRAEYERRMLLAIDAMLDMGDAKALDWSEWATQCAPTPRRDVTCGRLAWQRGDAEAAERWLIAAADQDDDPAASLVALKALSVAYTTQSRGAEAVAVGRRVLDIVGPDAPEEPEAWAALVIGQGALGGAQSGLTLLRQRLTEPARDTALRDRPLLTARSTLRMYANLPADAADDLREAIRRATTPIQLIRLHMYLSRAEFALGAWDEALVTARVALDLAEQERYPWELPQTHRAITAVLAARGDWESARRHAGRAVDAALESGGIEQYFGGQQAQAELARAQGDAGGVVTAFSPMIASGAASLPMLSTLVWWATLIEAQIDLGELDLAAAAVDALADGWAARQLDHTARLMTLRGRLAAATGDGNAAIDWFGRAAASGSNLEWVDRANLHHQYGRALRAVGRRQAAIEQLRTAHQMMSFVGAEPFVERIAADLTAAGLAMVETGGRRSPLELTEREQDVAALVARGMTNKEVGAALYVSVKAVEYHLSNIYGKLGLSSRRELRDLMSADS